MGRQKTIEEEIAGLLDALGHQAREMPAVLAAAQKGIQHHTFAPYHALQEKVREHEALIAIIESRIERMRGKCPAHHLQRLDTLEREVLAERIRGSFNILLALSAIPLLPFGVRELFTGELKALSAAREKLRLPKHQGKCPPELEQDLETAEMIVMEVMEKAPCLVDLGDDDGRPADNPPPPPETAAPAAS